MRTFVFNPMVQPPYTKLQQQPASVFDLTNVVLVAAAATLTLQHLVKVLVIKQREKEIGSDHLST